MEPKDLLKPKDNAKEGPKGSEENSILLDPVELSKVGEDLAQKFLRKKVRNLQDIVYKGKHYILLRDLNDPSYQTLTLQRRVAVPGGEDVVQIVEIYPDGTTIKSGGIFEVGAGERSP